jgi:hypothetical protein
MVDAIEDGLTYYSAEFNCVSPIYAPALAEDAMELVTASSQTL